MKKLFTTILLLGVYVNIYSQVSQEWYKTYNGNGNLSDESRIVLTDKLGNVYVSGISDGDGIGNSFDYLTIKYNSLGILLWSATFDGPTHGDDLLKAMQLDSNGNIYVTGYSPGIGDDYLTIKYDSLGNQQWLKRYNGTANGNDQPFGSTIDDLGNLYITGSSYVNGSGWDYLTVKYNSLGDELWAVNYNGFGNSTDYSQAIKVDSDGNVFITGYIFRGGSRYDIATVKYTTDGIFQWSRIYTGPGDQSLAYALEIDSQSNVYITGSRDSIGTGQDFVTIKYNSLGDLQWISTYSGTASNEYAINLKVDSSNNVYVIGVSNNNYTTIKYNSLGIQEWVREYNGTANGEDAVTDLKLDNSQNVYVTGKSKGPNSNFDCVTIKYDSYGNEKWVVRFNGPSNSSDIGNSLSLDNFGNVIVTGTSITPGNSYDFLTIKYSQIPQIRITLKLLIEGMYFPLFNLMSRNDTVTAYLNQSSSPYNKIDSAKTIIDSLSFSGLLKFFNAPTGSYYISVNHFNTIETWSKTGGEYLVKDGSNNNYDFTTSISQAYGNRLKLKGSKYCLFSGDIDQSDFIDVTDLLSVYNKSQAIITGNHIAEDLNADLIVDASDITLCYNNARNLIGVISP